MTSSLIQSPCTPGDICGLQAEAGSHPAALAPAEMREWTEDWVSYDRNPRADNTIALSISADDLPTQQAMSYADGLHPVAWYKEFDGGRAFYTSLGSLEESWQQASFLRHVTEAIEWADRPPSVARVVLTRAPKNPVRLAVAEDGRVFYIERSMERGSGVTTLTPKSAGSSSVIRVS